LVSPLQAFSFRSYFGSIARHLDASAFGTQTMRQLALRNLQDHGIAQLADRFETRHASND
jgi:hypothetical protein